MQQLLTTKLSIPSLRPELVSRPRLIKQLNQGARLGSKLTLVSAPAGFGKTTLVSEWARNIHSFTDKEGITQFKIGWLSLDEGDNDLARFLAYLISALDLVEGSEPFLGEGVLDLLQSPQLPPAETILTSLINAIAPLPVQIILVLDDFHLVEAQPIHEAASYLLEHLSQNLHLVILTREDPQLPLARLRARGQLTELRALDLRFTASEAADFLNQVMGLNLSTEDISALETRTEGWIAGLQLAALSMQGSKDTTAFIKSFTGSHRFVLDYLFEEVLEQQPTYIQTFLLQTSILNRLTGPLCDAVRFVETEPSNHSSKHNLKVLQDGQEILETLENNNLFIIPLDEERHWYRYHHLFADLLHHHLRQTHAEQLPILHLRASEWYQQNGFDHDAIEHALRAEDYERAAQQIESIAEAVWASGVDTKLRIWLAELPIELVTSKPQLCIYHAWYLLATGNQQAADQALKLAERALEPGGDFANQAEPHDQDQENALYERTLRGRLATAQAFSAFYRGNPAEVVLYARQALDYLPKQDLAWRSTAIHILGDAYDFKGDMEANYHSRLEAVEASTARGDNLQIMIAKLKLAINLRNQGRLQQAIEICQQQYQFADESGLAQTVVAGWLLAIWGEALAEINDLNGALHRGKTGVEIAEHGGDVAMLCWSYVCFIRILFSRGDLDLAGQIIQKAGKIARESYMPVWMMNLIAAWQARIWLVQDNLEAVSRWTSERALDAGGEIIYLHEMEYIVLARIFIAHGQLEDAINLLQRLQEAAETGGRTSRLIEILALQSLAYQAQGHLDKALIPLERALILAEPGGFIRVFVDEGPALARILYETLSQDIAPNYVRSLLAAFPLTDTQQTVPGKSQVSGNDLVESLSEREIEVLQLLAEGLTNPEIAARLYLSLNTIKVHTRNIYGKLGVNNRTQAVGRARALGLLPSN